MIDIMTIIWVGAIAGLIVEAFSFIMYKLGFTTLNLISYRGCMATGEQWSTHAIVAGVCLHLLFSIVIAGIYAIALPYFADFLVWQQGLIMGLGHWLIASIVSPFVDKIHRCVAQGFKPLKAFASGYGTSGMITFLAIHLIYGLIVCYLFTHY